MNKLYNTQKEFTSNISKFLKKSFPSIRKTQLNIIPPIIFGMINSNSSSSNLIAANLKDEFSLVQFDSITRRIRRFFNNSLFNPYTFYQTIISYILSNYKVKHSNQKIHIIFDHMFSHDNYTVFMMSMRVGKQGIPLYFKCFKYSDSEAFKLSTITEGIDFVSNLFKNTNYKLVFLADRWFNSKKILKYIEVLGHTYCIRIKGNINVKVYDNKEGHYIKINTRNLKSLKYKGNYYENVYLYNDYKCNITVSKNDGIKEPWFIATNGNPNEAVRDYSHRFGGIETIFKNQKSNGFNIEKINNCNLKSFTSMYALVCFSITCLVIIGADYCKNTKCYKNVKFETHKIRNGKQIRVISLFKLGMLLIKRAFNSPVYIRIPYNFILYDI